MAAGEGGYEVGSGYVSVSPDAETFAEQLEEQIGDINLVVTIPVVPDASGLQAGVDSAVADSKATVVVPVTANPAGLQESIDAASKDSGAVVTVPVEGDPSGLAPQADAAAEAAADSAGTTFGEKFSSIAGQMSLFAPDEGAMAAEGGAAGQGAGAGFGDAFTAAAGVAGASLGAELTPQATAAGTEAGTGLGGAFAEAVSAAVSATASAWGVLTPAAETEGAQAGAAAGGSFSDTFGAALSARVAGLLDEALTAPAGWAGSAAGLSAGTGFTAAMSESVAKAVSETSAAWGEIPVAAETAARAAVANTVSAWGAIVPPAEVAGTEAGEAAGTGFMSRLASMLSGVTGMFAGMLPGAAAEGEAAGTAAGEGFASRFAAIARTVTGSLSGLIPGMAAEGEAGGEAAGEGFASRFRAILTGSISPMEALMGAGFVAVAADMAAKFQSVMEQIHTQAGVAQSAISGLSGGVLALAGQVGLSPDSLAKSLYLVESSFQSVGITGQAALQMVKVAAEGARTGNADLTDVTTALNNTMVASLRGVTTYSQAMGALNGIVGSGEMTMEQLAQAMSGGLMANAKLYGQSIYQVGAALADLGDSGVKGKQAATELRMAWQALLQPVSTAGDALSHLGLTSTQLGHTLTHQGLTAAIGEFVGHLKASKVPIADWGEYVTEIFGKKAGSGIGTLIETYTRLQSKLKDVTDSSKGFASAWAATQQTTSQKVKDLEGSFEALMIKIGTGLLPAVDSLMSTITRNLPGIEKFGAHIAHLIAPAVTGFFKILEDVLKELVGPLRTVTEAVIIGIAAFMGISKVIEVVKAIRLAWLALQASLLADPFVAVAAAVIALAFVIVKYHKQIWDVITKTWDDVVKFFASIADPILKPVEKAFDAIKKYITGGFDKWWKTHGEELEKVWKDEWDAVKTVFKTTWDVIAAILKAAWDLIGPVIEVGVAEIEMVWKVAWAAISAVFKTTWDVIAAIVKVAVAAVTAAIKIAWDVLVGTFNIFLDLVTGHWSKAWTDFVTTIEQVWNAINGFLGTVWGAISDLAVQIWNNISGFFTTTLNAIEAFFESIWNDISGTVKRVWGDIASFFATWWDNEVAAVKETVNDVMTWLEDAWNTIWDAIKTVWNAIHGWLVTWWGDEVQGWKNVVTTVEGWLVGAWDTIKTDAETGFNAVKTTVENIWNDIVGAVQTAVGTIQKLISSVTSAPGKAVSSVLGAIGLAGGGVIPGYAPGHDSVHAMLSPGEGVLVPEAVRAIGPENVRAINAHFSAGRSRGGDGAYAGGGNVPDPYAGAVRHYADGGIAGGGLSAYQAGQAAGQGSYSAPGAYGGGNGAGLTVYMQYYGTQYPTPEQQQAMMSRLALVAGAM